MVAAGGLVNNPGGAAVPEGVSATEWLASAKARGVNFECGSSYFLDAESDRYVRISFSLLQLSDIKPAVDVLAKSLDEAMQQGGHRSSKKDLFVPFV